MTDSVDSPKSGQSRDGEGLGQEMGYTCFHFGGVPELDDLSLPLGDLEECSRCSMEEARRRLDWLR